VNGSIAPKSIVVAVIVHVAMEATGVYWKPVWHILSDGEFELVLANAAHVKNVPGRKTDVSVARILRATVNEAHFGLSP
jgi:transposase